MQRRYLRTLLSSLVLVAFASTASAADLLVGAGQTYASVSAALTAAAATGDTIIIMDSATYTEPAALVINKSVSIVAAPNQNPTLACSSMTNSVNAITITTGAAGGRLGSLGGGRITIDRGLTPTATAPTNAQAIAVGAIGTGETYTIENVYITGFNTAGISIQSTLPSTATANGGVKGTLNLNVVEIDAGYTAAERSTVPVPLTRVGIRVVGSTLALATNFGGTFNFNRVSVRNIDSHALILNTSSTSYLQDVTLNLNTCEFSTMQHSGVVFGNNSNLAATIQNTLMIGGGGAVNASSVMVHSSWSALRYAWTTATAGTPSGTINVSNSVMTHHPNFGTSAIVNFPGGTANSNNINLTIDSSDIIVPLGATNVTTDVRSRLGLSFGASTNRNVALTNSIIYAAEYNDQITTPVGNNGMLVASGSTGSHTADYSNIVVSAYSSYETSGVTVGTHMVSPGVDPGYVDMANLDFRHTNPLLATAASDGGPLGTNAIMANIVPVELSSFGLN